MCAMWLTRWLASARLLQEALNEVLQAYVVHAMESGAGWLVPQLACHLRAGRRHLTCVSRHTHSYPCHRISLSVPLLPLLYASHAERDEGLAVTDSQQVNLHLLVSAAKLHQRLC